MQSAQPTCHVLPPRQPPQPLLPLWLPISTICTTITTCISSSTLPPASLCPRSGCSSSTNNSPQPLSHRCPPGSIRRGHLFHGTGLGSMRKRRPTPMAMPDRPAA